MIACALREEDPYMLWVRSGYHGYYLGYDEDNYVLHPVSALVFLVKPEREMSFVEVIKKDWSLDEPLETLEDEWNAGLGRTAEHRFELASIETSYLFDSEDDAESFLAEFDEGEA